MKSFTGKFGSARGWTLLLILFLGTGLFVAACGDEETPAPTTPTPPPAPPPAPPPPPPEPEPPAVPTGLQVSATGMDFIEWSWTPVEDVSGYDVQYSANEAFTDEDDIIARTAEEISYRKDGLEAGTSAYLRVRSASGADDDRITSDWSTHVTGMTMEAPPPPEPPATPTGLMVSDTTETSITWTWNAVEGATGYIVQASADEMFDATETVMFDGMPYTTETSYTAADLEADTTLYVRVAAAAGTVDAPLVSEFTTHVTGMTMAATLAAPANVRDTSRGSDYVVWEWDAVAGADGYHAQFSEDSSFSSPDNFFLAGADSTSQRVANLDAESDGYFRVRAYTGTATDRAFGEWSAADEATTEEPPPPEPLGAPSGLEATDTSNDSITLEWDSVRNADSYEVEQRAPGDDWDDASCGGGDNVVEDGECVASDLDSGTDYDFRVRAVPADDDDAHTVGGWSDIEGTRTSGAAPPEPTAPVPGGMGSLNVRWETTSTGITWIWDRVGGPRYDYVILDRDFDGSATPCSGVDWDTGTAGTDHGEDTAATSVAYADSTAGNTRLLCVRTHDDDAPNKNLSYSWAITTPTAPAADTTSPAPAKDMRTTSLLWTVTAISGGFNYVFRAAEDPRRDDAIKAGIDDADLQAACEAGTLVDEGDTDVPLGSTNVRHDTGLTPYTGYTLCMRYENTAGRTAWAAAPAAEIHTRPAAPPPVRVESSTEGAQSTAVIWEFDVRNRRDVPRREGGFNAKTITYRESNKWDHDDDGGTTPERKRNTTAPRREICEEDAASGLGPHAAFTVADVASTSIKPTPQGIAVEADVQRPLVDADGTEAVDKLGDNRVHLCVQANGGTDGGLGPWTLSGSFEVKQQTE